MAAIKRLGRGLDNLIAGGAGLGSPPKSPAKKKKATAKKKTATAKKKIQPKPMPQPKEAKPSPAAMAEKPAPIHPAGFVEIPLEAVDPNPRQPRQ